MIPTPFEEENKKFIESLLNLKKHYEKRLEEVKEQEGKCASLMREYNKAQLNEVKTRLKEQGVDTDANRP